MEYDPKYQEYDDYDPDGPPPRAWLWWFIRGFALVAVAVSAYLAYVSYQGGTVAGCGGLAAADCEHVLKSRWSRVLTVPVSVPAAVVYGSIFLLAWIVPYTDGRTKAIAETLLVAAALLAIGAGVYFFILQMVVVGKFCIFCMTVHACGLFLASLVLFHAGSDRAIDHSKPSGKYGSMALGLSGSSRGAATEPAAPRPNALIAVGAPLVGLALLITAQQLVKPKTFEVVDLDTNVGTSADRADKKVDDSRFRRVNSNSRPEGKTPDRKPYRVLRPELPKETSPKPAEEDSTAASRPGLPGEASEKSSSKEQPAAAEESPASAISDGVPDLEALLRDARPQFDRYARLPGASKPVDLAARPRLGPREAQNVVIELFDYTCSHCRRMHKSLSRARSRYDSQLAVVLFPMPLSKDCNKLIKKQHAKHKNACRYAKIAMAVWRARPETFEAYHEWLMHGHRVPSLLEAAQNAVKLIGQDNVKQGIHAADIERLLQENIDVYAATKNDKGKRGGLPILFAGSQAVFGAMNAEELYPILENGLNMQPAKR